MYLDTDVVVLRDPLAPPLVQTPYDVQAGPCSACKAMHKDVCRAGARW